MSVVTEGVCSVDLAGGASVEGITSTWEFFRRAMRIMVLGDQIEDKGGTGISYVRRHDWFTYF